MQSMKLKMILGAELVVQSLKSKMILGAELVGAVHVVEDDPWSRVGWCSP